MHRFGKQLALTLICASTLSANAGECTVAVAANFAGPMRAIVTAFEARHDHKATLSVGSSGKFVAQIGNGAPFDILLSADQARVDAIDALELSVAGSRFTYATGRLVLWSSEPDLAADGRERLLQGQYSRLALANPRLAPYGRAAVEVLDSLGVTDNGRSKWVMGENVAQAFAFVHSGNADIGFVAASQVLQKNKGIAALGSILWRVDSSLHAPIHQDAVLLKRAQHNTAALDLLAFLSSSEAVDIIASFGYDTRTTAADQKTQMTEASAET